jgi:pyridoxal phosphate enzyme (YggS family)
VSAATVPSFASNLCRVRECIARAAANVGRKPEEVTLIAVSKTHPAEAIRAAYEAGLRDFGENRVQEWETKYEQVKDLDAHWHLVGHLQRNKVPRALKLFHFVDSVHSLDLVRRMNTAPHHAGPTPILLEVRMDTAPAKSGFNPDEVPDIVGAVIAMPHLNLRGLMCVPPYFDDPDQARPYFRRLRELRDALARRYDHPLPTLSMGMSHDFEVAIEEGATEIRLGTALFGARPPA